MVSIQEMERMVHAIGRGEPKPSLDAERSDLWDKLAADVDRIRRRGGKVQMAFDVPLLDESDEAKLLGNAAPVIGEKKVGAQIQPRNPRKGWF